MNDITTYTQQLPDKLQDLSRFILVGREKVTAIRAEIRAIDKLGLAKEVHTQKAQEAQLLAEALIDAEVRVGQLTPKIPKASGRPSNSSTQTEEFLKSKTKANAIKNLGFTKDQVHEFEKMAKHPELVEQAKSEAHAIGRPVTRARVMQIINGKKSESKPIEINYQFPEGNGANEEYIEAINRIEIAGKIRDAIFAVSATLSELPSDEYAEIFINQNADVFSKDELINDVSRAICKLDSLKSAMYAHKKVKVVQK